MAIREKDRSAKLVIDISGPAGNAFALIGTAARFGRQIGLHEDEIKDLQERMMEGDYEHLIECFDETFGDYVDLVR